MPLQSVERLIGRLKQQPDYRFATDVEGRDVTTTVVRRTLQMLRALLRWPFLQGASPPFFVGRRVTIRGSRHVRLGRAVTLDDFVFIEATSTEGVTIGRASSLARGVEVRCSGVLARPGVGLTIGAGVGIASNGFIGAQGGITIEDDVIIGPKCILISENHNVPAANEIIRDAGETRSPITIGSGAWLGARVTVLAGVSVGQGAVVGAGSVVTQDVPPNAVVVGVPAKVVRWRDGASAEESR